MSAAYGALLAGRRVSLEVLRGRHRPTLMFWCSPMTAGSSSPSVSSRRAQRPPPSTNAIKAGQAGVDEISGRQRLLERIDEMRHVLEKATEVAAIQEDPSIVEVDNEVDIEGAYTCFIRARRRLA